MIANDNFCSNVASHINIMLIDHNQPWNQWMIHLIDKLKTSRIAKVANITKPIHILNTISFLVWLPRNLKRNLSQAWDLKMLIMRHKSPIYYHHEIKNFMHGQMIWCQGFCKLDQAILKVQNTLKFHSLQKVYENRCITIIFHPKPIFHL